MLSQNPDENRSAESENKQESPSHTKISDRLLEALELEPDVFVHAVLVHDSARLGL